MSYVDGVGDEVLGLLVSVLATFLVAVLWKTTQVQLETLVFCNSFENHKLCITMYMYIVTHSKLETAGAVFTITENIETFYSLPKLKYQGL